MWISFFFCSFFKLIITEHKSHNFLPIFFRASPSSSISEDVQFTVTKKDNIIGWRIWMYCLFYVGEQQPISFFVPHFLIKSHDVSCFYFLNLLPCFYIHMYVKPPGHFTHPHTRCPEKEKGTRQSKHGTNGQIRKRKK